MSATITTLPPRSKLGGEAADHQHQDAGAVQPVEGISQRDSFIAETAVKLDRLQETNRLLLGDVGELVVKVAALQEACASEDRRYGFHQAEKRLGESKLGEVVRHYRDLKARLDRIEARAVGSYHAYGSLGEVSRKLGELEQQRDEAERIGRAATIRAWLFCGTALAATIIVAFSVVLSDGHL